MSSYELGPDFSVDRFGIVPTSVQIAPESEASVRHLCACLSTQTEHPRDTGFEIVPEDAERLVDIFIVGGKKVAATVVYTVADVALFWHDTEVRGKGDILAVRFQSVTPREVQAAAFGVPGAVDGPTLASLFIAADDLFENPQVTQ